MSLTHAPLSWRHELGRLLRLAGPLIVNNLSIAGMHFADAVMAGRLGARSLAGVAIGGSVWFFMFTIGLGILMAISPIAARHHGEGRQDLIGRYTRQGIWLAIAFSVPVIVAAHFAVPPALIAIGVDPDFRDITIDFVKAISWGAPGIFLFLAMRFTTEGIGETRPVMYTSVFALACNVFLNWCLMYGHFGFPALGAVGCAVASAITMWAIGIILTVYMLTHRRYVPLKLVTRIALPRPGLVKEIVALGLPIAVMVTAEAGLFNAVAVLMGTRGTEITAAHQIAINFATIMFMVPLALSSAITVRVGHELGAGNYERARYAGGFGIVVCALFMTLSACIMLGFRHFVVRLYTDDASVQSYRDRAPAHGRHLPDRGRHADRQRRRAPGLQGHARADAGEHFRLLGGGLPARLPRRGDLPAVAERDLGRLHRGPEPRRDPARLALREDLQAPRFERPLERLVGATGYCWSAPRARPCAEIASRRRAHGALQRALQQIGGICYLGCP